MTKGRFEKVHLIASTDLTVEMYCTEGETDECGSYIEVNDVGLHDYLEAALEHYVKYHREKLDDILN